MSRYYLTWWNEIRWNSFLSEGKLQAYWQPCQQPPHPPAPMTAASTQPNNRGVAQQQRGSRAWTVTWTENDPANHICSHLQCGRRTLCCFKGQISVRLQKHMSAAQETRSHCGWIKIIKLTCRDFFILLICSPPKHQTRGQYTCEH